MTEILFHGEADVIPIIDLSHSKVFCNWQSNTFTINRTDHWILATFVMRILAQDGAIELVKHIIWKYRFHGNNVRLSVSYDRRTLAVHQRSRTAMRYIMIEIILDSWYELFRINSPRFGKNYTKSLWPRNNNWSTISQRSSWKLHWL
jgi:hypothetical protein